MVGGRASKDVIALTLEILEKRGHRNTVGVREKQGEAQDERRPHPERRGT